MPNSDGNLNLPASPQEFVSRQLDPPPFYLEGEIRVGGSKFEFFALGLGLVFVALFPVLLYRPAPPLPSLSILFVVALVSASLYLGIRFLVYWGMKLEFDNLK